MLRPIPATLMRGGTSKGLYFHAAIFPRDRGARDRVLLAAMGSPDIRADRRHRRSASADEQSGGRRSRHAA